MHTSTITVQITRAQSELRCLLVRQVLLAILALVWINVAACRAWAAAFAPELRGSSSVTPVDERPFRRAPPAVPCPCMHLLWWPAMHALNLLTIVLSSVHSLFDLEVCEKHWTAARLFPSTAIGTARYTCWHGAQGTSAADVCVGGTAGPLGNRG